VSSPAPSFEAVYARHAALVRRVLADRGVSTADLDDAVQETFVIVNRLLPEFEGRSSLETWLHAIAWRVAANQRRRAKALRTAASTDIADIADEPPPSAGQVEASLAGIDGPHRDLLALHDIGELSISSLAAMTGQARATIRQRIARARATVSRALQRT
jgi:RNA polymerase sigma-70 factor, ECF subfamily